MYPFICTKLIIFDLGCEIRIEWLINRPISLGKKVGFRPYHFKCYQTFLGVAYVLSRVQTPNIAYIINVDSSGSYNWIEIKW